MNRGMSRRARTAAAAAAASEVESLRQGCHDALLALEESRTRDALTLAVDLTRKHPDSAIAFNLAGSVFEIAGNRPLRAAVKFDANRLSMAEEDVLKGLSDGVDPYFGSAMKYYTTASRLAPNCVVTALANARMFARNDLIPEAFDELKRAIGLKSPTHPNLTCPWVFGVNTDPAVKKQMAKDSASEEFSLFLGMSEDVVYTKSCELIARHALSTDMAAGARREAKELGARYPFSPRAQMLFPYLHREFVQNLPLPPDADRSRLYRQLLEKVRQCADLFLASVVVSLFHAKLLSDVGEQKQALQECIRGLDICLPDDPADQDLPPGSVDGPGRAARVATVTQELLALLEDIEDNIAEDAMHPQAAVDEAPKAPKHRKPQRKKIPKGAAAFKHGKIPSTHSSVPQVPMEHPPPNDHNATVKHSVIYRFSKLPKKDLPAAPRTEQIVGGVVVPANTVDRYADYCRIHSRCSKYKLVCHMCVVEDLNFYTCKFPRGDIIWHCCEDHKSPGIECSVDDCSVRFKTEEEACLHNHYHHALPKDWWMKWGLN